MTAKRKQATRQETSEKPRLLYFGSAGRNRELLVDALGDEYDIEATTEPSALDRPFDCCLLTGAEFSAVRQTIERRQTETSCFLPFVLLVEDGDVDSKVWDYVDDVVTLPVKEAALRARIGNLVERRQTATKLAEREQELQSTVDELRVKEQALDEAPVGFSISDATAEDNQMVYVNDKFLEMTGYRREEVLGRNCRFLQGEETSEAAVGKLREALIAQQPVSVDIVNYRKNGEKFWNKLDISPLRNSEGEVTHFVGFQTDITERKVNERRREVLNRVLSHNLRNKMNVIEAYLELIRSRNEPDPTDIEKIEEAAENLHALAETARETDRILTQTDADERLADPGERLKELVDAARDRYPSVSIDLAVPEDGVPPIAAGGLLAASREALENAAKHNDRPDAFVSIRLTNRDDGWVDIDIEDNGPGIPQQELHVLDHGEKSLRHADRMGIWLIYWTVTRAGGTMTVSARDDEGTVITLSVPTADEA
jgi:PAS domain S-box-containing protein